METNVKGLVEPKIFNLGMENNLMTIDHNTIKSLKPQDKHFSSVQFSHSVVSDSLRPHELQHDRPPCPSPTPGVHPNSRPSSR